MGNQPLEPFEEVSRPLGVLFWLVCLKMDSTGLDGFHVIATYA